MSPAATVAADRYAIGQVRLAAILALIGGLLYVAQLIVGDFSSLLAASTTSSGGVIVVLPPAYVLFGLLLGLAAIVLVEFLLFRSAFHRLLGPDRRFSTPSALALVGFIGYLMLILGGALLIAAIYAAVTCVGSGNPLTQACLFTGAFWGGLALLLIGAIIALVGYIGVLVGIWRLGTRYEDGTFKVAAVLLIFPLLNIVGAILVLVACGGALRRVESRGSPVAPSW